MIGLEMLGRFLNPWGFNFGAQLPIGTETAGEPIPVPASTPPRVNAPLTPDEARAMLDEAIVSRGETGEVEWLTNG